jgi:RHS repeat-associated protein
MVAFAENKICPAFGGALPASLGALGALGVEQIIYYYGPETENYYVRNRYYTPTLGRWLTRDPIGTQGGINLYAYVASNPAGYVDAWGLAGCRRNAMDTLNKALSRARNQFLDEVSQDEIQGTQIALDENAAGQLADMTDTAEVGAVGGFAGDAFKAISAITDAQRVISTLNDFREVGPLFDTAYEGAAETRTVSGFVEAMDGSNTAASIAVSAAASALASYSIFGNQGKALSAALQQAESGALNRGMPGLDVAFDVLSAVRRALEAAYNSACPLSNYITPMTRALYAARVASALRSYAKELAQCGRGCGSKK